jgi:hypothetical protein
MPLPAFLGRLRAPLPVVALVALVVAFSAGARADVSGSGSAILHEFIPADPGEDVTYATTTLEGNLPAAIQTPSGLAIAPDPRGAPGADHVYGGATTDDGPDSTYEPDRDTRRPNVENYDDPFSPATAPFKRLRAYDWVEADYSLRVRDKSLQKLSAGGTLGAGDEPFYGDLSVDLLPGQPVRIPTIGPGARVLRSHANPEIPFEVVRDGADNWFVRGTVRTRIRLVMELAIARDTFGREFADVDWSVLDALEASKVAAVGPRPQGVARVHEAALAEVEQAVGISRGMRPREVMRKMVDYFRGFSPSDQIPSGRGDIYLDLSLSRKGVCRHRAFAFLVTALGMGIPTRMVVNEAHAWVEVFDSRIWHRVDLGGAAANLDNEPDPSKPAYVPPPDPYAWPTARDSGQDLAERNRNQPPNGQGPGGQGPTADPSSTPSASPSTTPGPVPGDPSPSDPRLPESEVTVSAIDGDVHRGLPLHLQGQVQAAGTACPHLRVDVLVVGHAGAPPERRPQAGQAPPPVPQGVPIGSLSTDDRGRFDGAVIVPRDLSLGDYDLVVQTPGDNRCGMGRTR